ncbi:MAG: hypothetical protein LBD02_07490 [Christensenellaceae bacterium]|nr:hypothetical protein [Christensenellaceae bacterium]
MILHFGVTGGVGVRTAQCWSRNDLPSVPKALILGNQFVVAISLLFFLLSLACPEWIMQRFTNEPEVITQGVISARYLAPVYLTTGIVIVVLSVLRSVGTIKIALYTQISSLLINLVFNNLLIYGKGEDASKARPAPREAQPRPRGRARRRPSKSGYHRRRAARPW